MFDRLAVLEPGWNPELARAHTVLQDRLVSRRPLSWIWAPVAVVAVCFVLAVIPQTRAAAQEAWARWTMGRFDVIRVDLSKLPVQTHVTMNGPLPQRVSLEEATKAAGFTPYLPESGVAAGVPELMVIAPVTVDQTVRVADLQAALRSVGAADVQVPASWDGALLRTEIGPMVGADYPDGTEVLQVRPIAFYAPAGFALNTFAEVAFRAVGLSARDARAAGLAFAIHPAWLLDIAKDEPVELQDLSLRNGKALLIEEFGGEPAQRRTTILRNTTDRMFVIAAKTREIAVAVAESLP